MPDSAAGWFDGLPEDRARRLLLLCCAAEPFADRVLADRPYGSLPAAQSAVAAACAALAWDDVLTALSSHPRIGELPAGTGRSAELSRAEQAGSRDGARSADRDVAAELAAVNRRYEQRFGHVFLICAAGLSAVDMLAAARGRIGNDAATECRVVRTELAAIAVRRLRTLANEATSR